jgi:hypothetical protein
VAALRDLVAEGVPLASSRSASPARDASGVMMETRKVIRTCKSELRGLIGSEPRARTYLPSIARLKSRFHGFEISIYRKVHFNLIRLACTRAAHGFGYRASVTHLARSYCDKVIGRGENCTRD